MKKLSLACALSAAALGLTAAMASAAGRPASPSLNETVKGAQPTFTWTVPAGETVQSILIAPNKHSDDGVLSESMDVGEVAGKTATTTRPASSRPATTTGS